MGASTRKFLHVSRFTNVLGSQPSAHTSELHCRIKPLHLYSRGRAKRVQRGGHAALSLPQAYLVIPGPRFLVRSNRRERWLGAPGKQRNGECVRPAMVYRNYKLAVPVFFTAFLRGFRALCGPLPSSLGDLVRAESRGGAESRGVMTAGYGVHMPLPAESLAQTLQKNHPSRMPPLQNESDGSRRRAPASFRAALPESHGHGRVGPRC